MTAACHNPLPLSLLLSYRRGELEPAEEEPLEEHYFQCAYCSERLRWLEALQQGVRGALREGMVGVSGTADLVARLTGLGARLRHYTLGVGDSVNCTCAPGEDFVVVTLRAGAAPGSTVTVHIDATEVETGRTTQQHLEVLADQKTGDMVYAFPGDEIRALSPTQFTIHVQLGDGASARSVGPFTMNHSPWAG